MTKFEVLHSSLGQEAGKDSCCWSCKNFLVVTKLPWWQWSERYLSTQYLCIAGSWATKMLQPASFGVAKKRPGAMPGVKRGALGSSLWRKLYYYFIIDILLRALPWREYFDSSSLVDIGFYPWTKEGRCTCGRPADPPREDSCQWLLEKNNNKWIFFHKPR